MFFFKFQHLFFEIECKGTTFFSYTQEFLKKNHFFLLFFLFFTQKNCYFHHFFIFFLVEVTVGYIFMSMKKNLLKPIYYFRHNGVY
jgi:hypothetical protein